MTLKIRSVDVNCATGVQVTIEAVAQVKINADDERSCELAVENFLGMDEYRISELLNETMEGHQRSIISTMSVEDIFRDRESFSTKVRECATSDLMAMGVHLISYTISSCEDSNGYLEALAKPTIALLHRDARIGQAICERDAAIAKAEAEEMRDRKVYETKIAIEEYTNTRDLIMESNAKEVNTAKAIAENAKRLAEAEYNQTLINEKMQVKLIERKGEARVMDEEMKLQEKRLEATTLLNAATNKYTSEILAEATKQNKILESEANASEIQMIGEAEAEAVRIRSEAEARTTALKAQAYEQFGNAAMVGEVIAILPKIAAEIARPADEINKMTIVATGQGDIGFKRVTKEIMQIMSEVPEGVNEITGIDLKGEIQDSIRIQDNVDNFLRQGSKDSVSKKPLSPAVEKPLWK